LKTPNFQLTTHHHQQTPYDTDANPIPHLEVGMHRTWSNPSQSNKHNHHQNPSPATMSITMKTNTNTTTKTTTSTTMKHHNPTQPMIY
jgi:hypothetical protein